MSNYEDDGVGANIKIDSGGGTRDWAARAWEHGELAAAETFEPGATAIIHLYISDILDSFHNQFDVKWLWTILAQFSQTLKQWERYVLQQIVQSSSQFWDAPKNVCILSLAFKAVSTNFLSVRKYLD